MSQFDFGTIDPYVVDGVQLAGMLNQWRDAVHSWHRGPTRPTYAVPGMMWVNDSAGATSWVVNVFMGGGVDAPLFTYNTTTGAISVAAGSGGFTANLITAQGNSPTVAWNKTDNPIDVKRWQASVNAAGALVLSSLTDAGVVQQSFTFNRNGTLTQTGATPASFLVRATAVDTLSGPGSLTLFRSGIANPVKDYDPDNVWSLVNAQFTAPSAGRYNIGCHAYLAPAATAFLGLILTHRLAAGGVARVYGDWHQADQNNYGAKYFIDAELQMAAGDKADFLGSTSFSGAITFVPAGGAVASSLIYAYGHRIGN